MSSVQNMTELQKRRQDARGKAEHLRETQPQTWWVECHECGQPENGTIMLAAFGRYWCSWCARRPGE